MAPTSSPSPKPPNFAPSSVNNPTEVHLNFAENQTPQAVSGNISSSPARPPPLPNQGSPTAETTPANARMWEVEYYAKYFDVDTAQVPEINYVYPFPSKSMYN
jgi:hypothetical protein